MSASAAKARGPKHKRAAAERPLIIVANTLPVRRRRRSGEFVWETAPGGLVSALKPVLEKRPSTWVGWAGGYGKAPKPFRHEGIAQQPISLSKQQLEYHYHGFANRTLWPLYHDAIRTAQIRRRWWRAHVEVNQLYADAAVAAAAKLEQDGIVWVHDYQLQLVPQMVRDARPKQRIGFFLHIPFPPLEIFARLPWRDTIIKSLLAADVLGFQTRASAQNFATAARTFGGARGPADRLKVGRRTVAASAFPVAIDTAHYEALAASPEVEAYLGKIRAQLGPERRVVLGVDRLDYTKGIDVRMRAYEQLLTAGTLTPQDTVFVQVAVPTRESVQEYIDMRTHIETQVGHINGAFAELGRTPIHYFHRSIEPEELVAFYRAADVMVVTPLRDGMNLVAKEYVAARLHNEGALVLSEFAGAADELKQALLVNPYDIDDVADTIADALKISGREGRRRMAALRRVVRRRDVHAWADGFLKALLA